MSLFEVISEILNAISPAELRRLFHNWIEPVEAVIAAEGDYIAQ
jgi:predicted Zn-dependent peptidase